MTNEIQIKEFINLLKEFISEKELIELIGTFNETLGSNITPDLEGIEEFEENLSISKIRLILDFTLFHAEKWLDKEKHSELILSLIKFFVISGNYNFVVNLSNILFLRAKASKELTNYYGYSLLKVSEIYTRQALWKEAVKCVNDAKKLMTGTDDKIGIARCESMIGTIYAEQGKLSKAQSHFLKGLEFVEDNTQLVSGLLHNNLGIVNTMTGNFEKAITFYQRALVIFENLKKNNHIADTRHNIGMAFMRRSEYPIALNEFDKSIAAAMPIDYKNILAISYLSKSYTYTLTEDLSMAEVWLQKSMEIASEINDNLTIPDCYKVQGIIYRKKKNYTNAGKFFLYSLQLNKEYNNELNFAESCEEYGLLLKEESKLDTAKSYFDLALAYYRKIGSKHDANRIKSYLK